MTYCQTVAYKKHNHYNNCRKLYYSASYSLSYETVPISYSYTTQLPMYANVILTDYIQYAIMLMIAVAPYSR